MRLDILASLHARLRPLWPSNSGAAVHAGYASRAAGIDVHRLHAQSRAAGRRLVFTGGW